MPTPTDEHSLEKKELISELFKKFNKTLQDFSNFQNKLENQIKDLRIELSQKNEQMTNILESLSSGLVVTDLMGKVISVNKATNQITGLAIKKSEKKNLNDIFQQSVLPPKLDKQGLSQVANNYSKNFRHLKPGGAEVYLSTTTTLMISTETQENLGIIVNFNDVTLVKNLEETAERKNRLIAMGQIAASVAHEIRNPLGGMELFVSMLKQDLENDPAHLETIIHIQSAMRSMNHIISNILEYTKPRPITRSKVDLAKLVQEFTSFYAPHAKQRNTILRANITSQKAIIEGDFELIKQALQNIYMNAVQSMLDGGVIMISLDISQEISPEKIALFDSKKNPLQIATITIVDEGEGMSDEIKKKIFDPFFTTKPKGTGLGLSIVNQIINSHKGIILIDDILQKGTKISIQFKTC
ncbi:MAG: PAS domain S-box protein [SAR324 cluster bacterium]|nr:PAS domain S-box protein [SAR324 cluster bacterium]